MAPACGPAALCRALVSNAAAAALVAGPDTGLLPSLCRLVMAPGAGSGAGAGGAARVTAAEWAASQVGQDRGRQGFLGVKGF
jgi:hypothetical protein